MKVRSGMALLWVLLAQTTPQGLAAESQIRLLPAVAPPGVVDVRFASGAVVGPLPIAESGVVALAGHTQVGIASPSDPPRLTLAELEQIALANNPTLAQAAQRAQALRGKYLQVGLPPNPVLGYVGEDFGDKGTIGQQGAFVRHQWITGGKLRLNRAVAGHEVRQAEYVWEIQRWRVLNNVRTTCYEVLLAQRTVELDEELVRIGQEGVETTEAMLKALEVARIDLLQAQVQANTARLQLSNARNRYVAAWRKLAAVLGVPQMPPTPLADELDSHVPEFGWEETLAWLTSESPELARAVAGVERARCALARAYAGRVPDLNLEGSVRYSHAADETLATVEVGLPLQIFNRNQGNIAKARAELAAAHQEVARVKLQLQQRLADVFEQYASARQQTARYLDKILPDARETLRLVRLGQKEGEFGGLTRLTAERTHSRVNKAYIDSLRQLWISVVKIEGMLMTDGLQAAGP